MGSLERSPSVFSPVKWSYDPLTLDSRRSQPWGKDRSASSSFGQAIPGNARRGGGGDTGREGRHTECVI